MTPQPETTFRLPGRAAHEPTLLLRHVAGPGAPVLYVHGGTFPSALSFNWRFEGRSWADDLAARGFDAWSFDFAGFGGSDRPSAFAQADAAPPLLRAAEAADQLARVVDHVLEASGHDRVALVAHSWGSQPAGLFAGREPGKVSRLALFGAFAQRQGEAPAAQASPAWRLMTIAAQLARITADTPADHPSVLLDEGLAAWGPAYLATCPEGLDGVKVPNGPTTDVQESWTGALPWNPATVRAPTLLVRGAWDSLCTSADTAWLAGRLGAVETWDVRIPAAGHMAHLERGRERLFAATAAFLAA